MFAGGCGRLKHFLMSDDAAFLKAGSSLYPLAGLAVLVVAGTALAVLVFRGRGLPAAPHWLLTAAAVLPFAVLALLAVRPLLVPVPRLHHLAHAPQPNALQQEGIWRHRGDHGPVIPELS